MCSCSAARSCGRAIRYTRQGRNSYFAAPPLTRAVSRAPLPRRPTLDLIIINPFGLCGGCSCNRPVSVRVQHAGAKDHKAASDVVPLVAIPGHIATCWCRSPRRPTGFHPKNVISLFTLPSSIHPVVVDVGANANSAKHHALSAAGTRSVTFSIRRSSPALPHKTTTCCYVVFATARITTTMFGPRQTAVTAYGHPLQPSLCDPLMFGVNSIFLPLIPYALATAIHDTETHLALILGTAFSGGIILFGLLCRLLGGYRVRCILRMCVVCRKSRGMRHASMQSGLRTALEGPHQYSAPSR